MSFLLYSFSSLFRVFIVCLPTPFLAFRLQTVPDWAAFDHMGKADVQLIVFGVLIAQALVSSVSTWVRSRVSEYVLSSFLPLQVVATIVLSFLFFNAQMTPHEGGGGACIILGLLMVCLATHRQETQTLTGYGPVEDDDDFGIQDHDLFNPHGQHEEL